jgi:hypothetical protein
MTLRSADVRFVRKGEPGWLEPGSDAWRRVITPSKVAAILGEPGDPVSRYESPYRLWHRMKGVVPPEGPRDAFDLGHDVEAFAAARYRRLHPDWLLSPGEVQAIVDPGKFGFPCVATLDRRAMRGRSRRVVEFKMARNLTDLEVWGDDLKGDCPDDYAAQLMAQMLFTGWTAHPAHLLVIGPYLNERVYEIGYDLSVASWIIDKCQPFWDSLAGDEPPPLDNTTATYECLRALHPDIEQGMATQLDDDEAAAFIEARVAFERAEAAYGLERNLLLKRMANDQRAECDGVKIAERRRGRTGGVSFYPNRAIQLDDLPAT